jgi:hypothetical protein
MFWSEPMKAEESPAMYAGCQDVEIRNFGWGLVAS